MIKIVQKKKDRTKLIILLVIITVILGIILCILHIVYNIKNNTKIVKKFEIASIENDSKYYSIEEILKSFECKDIYITYEKNDKGVYKTIVNLKFKYNLYEGEESKEDYFNRLVDLIYRKNTPNFKLIDSYKRIEIDVDKDYGMNEKYKINGVIDFYKNNSYLKVNNHKELDSIDGYESTLPLSNIMSANWDRSLLKSMPKQISVDEDYVYFENFKYNYTDRHINYIVFSKDYSEKVFENINVGESFSKIENKLGKPTFREDNKMIGYKDKNSYVFFYSDEIVIYPASSIYESQNYEMEEKLVNYFNQEKTLQSNVDFINEFLEEYRDFDSEIVSEGVRVYSISRGIELLVGNDSSFEIKIFDNYKITSLLKSLAQTNKIEIDYDIDTIYEYEKNRESY